LQKIQKKRIKNETLKNKMIFEVFNGQVPPKVRKKYGKKYISFLCLNV
jgi:Mor family transcriptional regulator